MMNIVDDTTRGIVQNKYIDYKELKTMNFCKYFRYLDGNYIFSKGCKYIS